MSEASVQPPVPVAGPAAVPQDPGLRVDALPGGALLLTGLMVFVAGVVQCFGLGDAPWWLRLMMPVVGALSIRCGWRIIVGPPASWLTFVQANALFIAMDLMDRQFALRPTRLPWRMWVICSVVWGVARAVNLDQRRRGAPRAGDPTASVPAS